MNYLTKKKKSQRIGYHEFLNNVVAYLNKVNVQRNKFKLILIDVWH